LTHSPTSLNRPPLGRSAERGVTLTELLVVVAIIGALVVVVVPSFNNWLRAYKVRTSAEAIQGDLRLARNVAVARNSNIDVLFKLEEFTWTDSQGKPHLFRMPPGVTITNLTDPTNGDTITMLNNGQVSNPSKTLTVDGWVHNNVHHVWTVSFTASGKVSVARTSP
jgi:prepilin-type N-terminal cleavage/methylation domain-containing protein